MTQHGMKHTRTYRIWCGIKRRCLNRNDKSYCRYGAVGIGICERWMAFTNFFADMGACPDNWSIDRLDNYRGYEPANCRWASATQQIANRRIRKDGEIRERVLASMPTTRKELIDRFGFTPGYASTVLNRLMKGGHILVIGKLPHTGKRGIAPNVFGRT